VLKTSVIGTGYVGRVTGAWLGEIGAIDGVAGVVAIEERSHFAPGPV